MGSRRKSQIMLQISICSLITKFKKALRSTAAGGFELVVSHY